MEHEKKVAEEGATIIPHVLIFPLPIQGPLTCALQLAELLCLEGIKVTFLNTSHNQDRLLRCTNIKSRFDKYHDQFQVLTISDGLPDDHPRSMESLGNFIGGLQTTAEPILREMLIMNSTPVTCMIPDARHHYAVDIGIEMGVHVIQLDTLSPSCQWVYLCLPKLIQAGELPFQGVDLDAPVTQIPAMEGLLRGRDLPHFCCMDFKTDPEFQSVLKKIERIPKSQGLILNTFEDLDSSCLSCISSVSQKTYAIGPLHLHLKTKLATEDTTSYSNSLWEEDESSINWLDAQPIGSVIYVSFGSLIVMSREEIFEFWHGLLNSKGRFLWAIRPGILKGGKMNGEFMKELVEGCQGKGYIVNWAPQKKVLAHPAVGGFLTHSGWNSTLESIVEGKPMLCWSRYVDQRVISRLVNELWRGGLDMKDICDRSTIERLVNELLGTKRHEFQNTVEKLSMSAKESVREEGSSRKNFHSLIDDIKKLTRH